MTPHWRDVLRRHFGIAEELEELEELDSGADLSFRGQSIVANVMAEGCDPGLIAMQIDALKTVSDADFSLPIPCIRAARDGSTCLMVADERGHDRLLWVREALPGVPAARLGPQPPDVLERLGQIIGRLDAALQGFEHDHLSRDPGWDLMNGESIKDCLEAFDDEARRQLLTGVVSELENARPSLSVLPRQAIHNGLNGFNILLAPSLTGPTDISGILGFSDMKVAPRVSELAIAGAHVSLGRERPEAALAALVRGYNRQYPLDPDEIDLIWPLLRMRLALGIVYAPVEDAKRPDGFDDASSPALAWRLLERTEEASTLVAARLRVACDMPAVESANRIQTWLESRRGDFAPVIDMDLSSAPIRDLSVDGSALPRDPFAIQDEEATRLGADGDWKERVSLGRYGEPRLIYTDTAFRQGPWKNSDRRTVYLGIELFAPAGTPVRAPHAGRVAALESRSGRPECGGVVVLDHETSDGDRFQTLYGYLRPEDADSLAVGQWIEKGEVIGWLGTVRANGGWSPHLHFQLALIGHRAVAALRGVANPDDIALWQAVCPNPAALLNLADEKVAYEAIDEAAIMEARDAHFAANLSLSYHRPLMLLRGWRHHMFDEFGRSYLDAYNNVPHVGHAHPRIQKVCANQLSRLNTNTRYLHYAQTQFAETLLGKLPQGLDTVFMVNSGSEANELALRLARSCTGGVDMITPRDGYHGITTGAMDISSYKFDKPGGGGRPPWVHLVDVADDYRGRFKRVDPERAFRYAGLVDDALAAIEERGGRLAGFIAETFPSVGGQIIPPEGYLPEVYSKVRAAGGVCIADEVQTGLGRLGEYYFGFEQQGARPDIVVLGKPIGNGHPIGVVVTTREIAARFAKGPEFFSTFGGSTLSCRIAKTVLDIVDEEELQENAAAQGARLIRGLRRLQEEYPVIGDVRGIGLFTGVELVSDRETQAPATEAASFVINELREMRILIGREGPADNILKIRPPLTIDSEDIDALLQSLDRCFQRVELIRGALHTGTALVSGL